MCPPCVSHMSGSLDPANGHLYRLLLEAVIIQFYTNLWPMWH
jgi:hypothetical protein